MKTRQFTRDLWIRAQLGAPDRVRQSLIPRLHAVKELARLAVRPYLPVYQLRGEHKGERLTVAYAGLDYAKPFLKGLLFEDEPVEEPVDGVPFWRYRQLADLEGDLIVVEAAAQLVDRLPARNAIVLPQYVHHYLDVRGDWGDVKDRFRKSVRYEFRLTRKYGYDYEVSHVKQDFETFYRDMYLPTMEARHGELASPMAAGKAYQYFRHGLLFFVTRDGQRVGGSVCHTDRGVVHFIIMGLLDGDYELLQEGAAGALNCLRIEWANREGYRAVNFLGTDPHLADSLFQYKRKWGTALCVPADLHRRIWIKVRRITPAVSTFLQENPFIVVDRKGELYGLVVLDDPYDVPSKTKSRWKKRYVTPGLKSLLVRSVDSFTQDPMRVDDPELVIPIAPTPLWSEGR